jgi:hypothetical protein
MSHHTTLHRFFTTVTFPPLHLGCAPHTTPSSNGALQQMVLTDFFQRAAAVAGAGAGEGEYYMLLLYHIPLLTGLQ